MRIGGVFCSCRGQSARETAATGSPLREGPGSRPSSVITPCSHAIARSSTKQENAESPRWGRFAFARGLGMRTAPIGGFRYRGEAGDLRPLFRRGRPWSALLDKDNLSRSGGATEVAPYGGGPAQVSQSGGATEVAPYGCQPGDRPPSRSRRTGRWTRRSCRTPRAGRARSRARRPRRPRPTPSSRPWRARPARSPGRQRRLRWP